MPTIRDLVAAIREREGVLAAIVLGRDGIVIDGHGASPAEVETVAAHVPPILLATAELGAVSQLGPLQTAVLELERGVAVVSALSPDAALAVLAAPGTNLAQLLYELRRHRADLASLV